MQNDKFDFVKSESGGIWWVNNPDVIGEWLFSFDKKKVFNLFSDYPEKLTKEEKLLFDKENPFWANFFKDREVP